MQSFQAILHKYTQKGEKSGWTYVEIPTAVLAKLKRKNKKAFRIKGSIDNAKFEKMTTYAIGDGAMIIAVNAQLRKTLGKKEGAVVKVKFEVDEGAPLISQELMDCLKEDKVALSQFESLTLSHQTYFHRYIESAKTTATKAGRIVNTIDAMLKKQNFGEMIRSMKKK